MAYRLGKCACCNKKIGYFTANNVFKYQKDKMAQISIVYKMGKKTTSVHIPVCKQCAENPNIDDIENNLGKEKNFKAFTKLNKVREVKEIIKDELPWD